MGERQTQGRQGYRVRKARVAAVSLHELYSFVETVMFRAQIFESSMIS